MDTEFIWGLFDNEIKPVEETINCNNNYCIGCKNELHEKTCRNCGLVISNELEFSNYIFTEDIIKKPNLNQNSYSRLLKLQEWSRWSNSEKNQYKLENYTKELCDQLKINKNIIDSVRNLVSQVMLAIKESCDGPKRSRVKDGIIIMCIYYISKNGNVLYSYIELSKQINLNMKYISRADKLIMDLIRCKKLQVSDEFVLNMLKPENPIDFILKIIRKYDLNIKEEYIKQISNLIDVCEDNDLLSDHTPSSIGIVCFYYVLNTNGIDVNVKVFSEIHDLSIVTIIKTFNKLKKLLNKIGE